MTSQERYLVRPGVPSRAKGPSHFQSFLLLLLGAVLVLTLLLGPVLSHRFADQEETGFLGGFSGSVFRSQMLDVPFIDQREKYPTGCESVSAVMALQYFGEEITVEEFIDDYLPLGNAPYLDEEGVLRGSDPREAFLGDPYSESGWGCYAPVIEEALERYCGDRYQVLSLYDVPLDQLCLEYIDRGIPVLLWATANMAPAQEDSTWITDENGEEFTWITPMHCLLLVGYDGDIYYFNDPMEGKSVSYGKEEVESAYAALGSQAVVVLPDSAAEIPVGSGQSTESILMEKLDSLRQTFPDGKYWNTVGADLSGLSQEEICSIVTDEPCCHSENGISFCHEYNGETRYAFSYDTNVQCLAFASMISDFLFGKDAGVEIFYEYDQLAVGDHIRFLSGEHSVIVIEKNDDFIRVVECNRDYESCRIEWDRKISREELLYDSGSYEFLRRIPRENPDTPQK